MNPWSKQLPKYDRLITNKEYEMARPKYTSEELSECKKQLEVCKKVIKDISWMSRRYANGRKTYAVGMVNDAIKMLDDNELGYLHQTDPMDNERFASENPKDEFSNHKEYKYEGVPT